MIDADFEGEIKVMTHLTNGIFVVQSGQSLAQLILLTQVQTNNPVKKEERGKSAFGASDAYWLQAIGP